MGGEGGGGDAYAGDVCVCVYVVVVKGRGRGRQGRCEGRGTGALVDVARNGTTLLVAGRPGEDGRLRAVGYVKGVRPEGKMGGGGNRRSGGCTRQ